MWQSLLLYHILYLDLAISCCKTTERDDLVLELEKSLYTVCTYKYRLSFLPLIGEWDPGTFRRDVLTMYHKTTYRYECSVTGNHHAHVPDDAEADGIIVLHIYHH